MNMRKFYLLTLLAFLPLLANADAVEIDGIYYNLDAGNHTAEVTTNPNGYSGDVVIPAAVMSQAANYSVTSIGYLAFRDCFSLTSITIPKNVTSIDYYAFLGCSALTSIQVESDNSVYDSRDNCNAIIETSTNTLIRGCKNTIIPTSVTTIGVEAFNCASGLLSLTIPSSVTSIGHDAFEACSDLVHVYCNAENVPTTDADAFENVDIGRYVTLHVPAGSVEAYQAAAPWNGFNKVVALSTNIPDVEILGIYYNLNEETLTAEVTKNPNGPYSGDLIVGGGIWYDSRLYSVTSIGKDAFALNGGITSVSIQEGVTTIGEGAFGYCPYLTSVTFPSSLISIGGAAFYGCERLTSVTIPANVTSISDNSFRSCKSLASIQVEDGNTKYDSRNDCNAIIEKENNTLISGCKNTVIPDNVTSIGVWAFEGISGLTSVTIPNSVTSIGAWSFAGTGLTSLAIPASVTTIDNDAFTNCSNLASIQVADGNTTFDSRDNSKAIIETATNTLIRASNTTVIPSSVTSIGYRAFGGSGITSISIPTSITSIGYMAFTQCKDLESISVESGNTKYDSHNNCNAIIETETNTLIAGCKNTIIPNTVTTIGQYAFGALGLTSITIPGSVTSIDHVAFWGNIELTDVYCNAESVPNTETDAFSSVLINQVTLHVPASSVDAYKAVAPWSGFKEVVAIESKKTIHVETAGTLSTLIPETEKYLIEDLTLTGNLNGDDLALIRDMAGNNINGQATPGILTTLDMSGASIVAGGTYAQFTEGVVQIRLRWKNGPEEINGAYWLMDFPEGADAHISTANTIGAHLFEGCGSLETVKLPNSLISIEDRAFSFTQLKSIIIPSSVESIDPGAFGSDPLITSITVDPENAKYESPNSNCIIEKSSHTLIVGCNDMVIPADKGLISIGDNAFNGRTFLTRMDIPEGITTIGNAAFMECRLISVTLPSTLETIGFYALGANYNTTDVYCKAKTVPTTDVSAFVGSNMENVTLHVPAGSVEAYQAASPWSGFKEVVPIETKKTINVETAGTLVTLIPETEKYLIEELTLTGNLNGDDLALLRDMAGNNKNGQATPGVLTTLDMSGASIVAGGTYAQFTEGVVQIRLRWKNGPEEINGAYWLMDFPEGADAHISTANTIGAHLFEGCGSLETVKLPNSLISIEDRAFSFTQLKSIIIPSSVESIDPGAFGSDPLITSITVDPENAKYESPNSNCIIEKSSHTLIVGCNDMVIPADKGLISIGDNAFNGRTFLTRMDIPEGITTIGNAAFMECRLISVTLPSTLETIGFYALGANYNTTDVYCKAKTVPTTDVSAFVGSNMENVTLHVPAGSVEAYQAASPWSGFKEVVALRTNIPDVEILGVYYNLNEETLTAEVTKNPDGSYSGDLIVGGGIWYDNRLYSVTSIGSYAFYFCEGLTSITIPNSVTKIFGNPFQGCSSLESISVEDGNSTYDSRNNCNAIIETGSNTLISGCKNTLIPASVTSIGDNAFTEIANLTSISIPASVEYIGSASFSSCSNLESIQVESGNTKYDSRNNCNAIIETASNTLIHGCKNTVIPANVTSIGEMAFDECDGLTSVTIPSAVTFIGISAFEECKDLVSMQVESGNTVYDSRNNCNAIIETASNTLISGCKNTIIPISVTSIGENAFRYCFGLESVTIPCDVTSIGNMAFFNCYQLTDIYCSAENVPTTGYGAFDAINGNNVTLHVPAGSVEAYKAASPWKDFGAIYSSVTSLFDGTNLWTSYVAQEDYAIPAGLEAYVISSLTETSAVASQIDYIPQGVPILLKRNDATTNSFDFTIGTGTAPTTNLLKVYDTDKTVSNREGYILFKDEFVLVDEGTLPAGRVFLPLNGGNSANTRGIVIEGEGTTGIQNLVSDSEVSHGVWYDLQGRKIDGKPIKKGVYILNGRKVVVK